MTERAHTAALDAGGGAVDAIEFAIGGPEALEQIHKLIDQGGIFLGKLLRHGIALALHDVGSLVPTSAALLGG